MEQSMLQTVRSKLIVSVNMLFLIRAVLISAGIAAIVIYLIVLSPRLEELDQLSVQREQTNASRMQLEQIAKPETVSDMKIRAVLDQTPTDEGWERFFAEMDDVIARTGVTIQQFDLDLDTKRLNELISKEQKEQGSAEFIEHPFTMVVQGSYPQVTAFFEHLYAMKRIVSVDEWDISIAQEKNNLPDVHQLLTLTVRAKIYQAQAYADVFSDIIPPKIIPTETRKDPTWSDQQYYDQLSSEGVMEP